MALIPDSPPRRRWVWLFPVTYLVHIAEEALVADGFPAWASRQTNLGFSNARFATINAIAWTAMALATWWAFDRAHRCWPLVTLATVVGLNGTLHVLASLLTRTYSPGLITGLALWIPLGAIVLFRLRRRLPRRQYLGAVATGMAAHALVTTMAVLTSMPPRPLRDGGPPRLTHHEGGHVLGNVVIRVDAGGELSPR